MNHQLLILFTALISSGFAAQNTDFQKKVKKDSLAKDNVQNIMLTAKENLQNGLFYNDTPSEVRINASLLDRANRSFNPFEPRRFEIANDVHYLPPHTRIPPVGIQKLTEIRIYQSK